MTTQKDFPFKSGDKITWSGWKERGEWCELLYAGDTRLFVKDWKGNENIIMKDFDWELCVAPKKTIRMAPALIRQPECHDLISLWPQSSNFLFETKEQAKNHFGDWFVQWPLTINGVEQWVDVPVEGE